MSEDEGGSMTRRRRSDDPSMDVEALRHTLALRDLESRIDAKLDEHEAHTAERAAALEARIDAKLDERLGEVVRRLDALASELPNRIADLEQERHDERVAAAAVAAVAADVDPSASKAATALSAWVAEHWRPWHFVVLAAFIVGGSTVVLPITNRILDSYLPSPAVVEAAP